MKNQCSQMRPQKQTNTRYGNMLYLEGDPTIGRSLELYGEYCHAEIEAIKSFVSPTSWFVDIGANIGTHTIGISPYVNRVVAFEPDSDNFDLLVKNISTCGCENVTPTPLAISDKFGEVATEFNYGKTTIVPGTAVKTASLDMIGLPQIDFVKMDVEGMELAVLQGMSATLQGFKPHLLIEMQDPKQYTAIYDLLKEKNYNMYWFPVPTYNPNNSKKNTDNVFGDQHGVINWICSTEQLNTTLQAVVDRDDTVERMVWRRNQDVGNDRKNGG